MQLVSNNIKAALKSHWNNWYAVRFQFQKVHFGENEVSLQFSRIEH